MTASPTEIGAGLALAINIGALVWGASKISTTVTILAQSDADKDTILEDLNKRVSYLEGKLNVEG